MLPKRKVHNQQRKRSCFAAVSSQNKAWKTIEQYPHNAEGKYRSTKIFLYTSKIYHKDMDKMRVFLVKD